MARHNRSLHLLVVVLSAPAISFAQGIVPAERATLWNPGIPGGIPSRTTVCATVSASTYGNGSQDATAGIQAAIDACPVGQVVRLSAGTFRILSPIRVSKGIVLRGAGPAQTLLKMPDGTSQAVIVVGVQWPVPAYSVDLTIDARKETSSVTVSSVAGLQPGDVVLIDKLTDDAITKWSPQSPPGDPSRGWFSRVDRPIAQMMEIAAISGNTVTFTTPFHITFDIAHRAQLSRWLQWGGNPPGPPAPAVKYAGVEDLHVYGGEGGDGGGNIRLELAAYCWVKNVESEYSLGGSIALESTLRSVVRDSYLHHTKDPNPGGGGYGISISSASADNLIENNIAWVFNKVMVMRATGGGNVIGYNYLEDGYISYAMDFVEVGLNGSHMTTPHYELFEGNESFNIDGDSTWGNSVYITFFRNHATGLRRSIGGLTFNDTDNRRAIGLNNGHYWYTFIGNVLGYAGMSAAPAGTSFRYENNNAPWSSDPVPMWQLGYDAATWGPTDPKVLATAIRDGNYDYATNSVHWDRTQQPIPDSLYLATKPAFFGTNHWPWVDPTGTRQLYVLPARARFDAMLGIGTPATPTNLRIIR